MFIFHTVVAVEEKLMKSEEEVFRGREGEAVEDMSCAVCAQLILMNFLLKMLSLRHTMEKSPFLLQRFFLKT